MPNHVGYDAVRKLLVEYFWEILLATACIDGFINGPVLNKHGTAALLEFSTKFTSVCTPSPIWIILIE